MPEKAEGDKSKGPGISRIKALEREHEKKHKDSMFEPDMPPLLPCSRALVEILWQIGPTVPAGMSAGPITQSEIGWFQHNTGIDLSEWEVSTLRRLSIDYVNESQEATKRDCPPPWGAVPGALLKLAASDLRASMRSMKNKE